MDLIDKIRKKPQEEKIRIIWITTIIVVILLIILWIFAGTIPKDTPKDTTLFQAIGQGVKDVKNNLKK